MVPGEAGSLRMFSDRYVINTCFLDCIPMPLLKMKHIIFRVRHLQQTLAVFVIYDHSFMKIC